VKRFINKIAQKCQEDARRFHEATAESRSRDNQKNNSDWDDLNAVYRRTVYQEALSVVHPSRFYYSVPVCECCHRIYVFLDQMREDCILHNPDPLGTTTSIMMGKERPASHSIGGEKTETVSSAKRSKSASFLPQQSNRETVEQRLERKKHRLIREIERFREEMLKNDIEQLEIEETITPATHLLSKSFKGPANSMNIKQNKNKKPPLSSSSKGRADNPNHSSSDYIPIDFSYPNLHTSGDFSNTHYNNNNGIMTAEKEIIYNNNQNNENKKKKPSIEEKSSSSTRFNHFHNIPEDNVGDEERGREQQIQKDSSSYPNPNPSSSGAFPLISIRSDGRQFALVINSQQNDQKEREREREEPVQQSHLETNRLAVGINSLASQNDRFSPTFSYSALPFLSEAPFLPLTTGSGDNNNNNSSNNRPIGLKSRSASSSSLKSSMKPPSPSHSIRRIGSPKAVSPKRVVLNNNNHNQEIPDSGPMINWEEILGRYDRNAPLPTGTDNNRQDENEKRTRREDPEHEAQQEQLLSALSAEELDEHHSLAFDLSQSLSPIAAGYFDSSLKNQSPE
jgi:hypothetical protein